MKSKALKNKKTVALLTVLILLAGFVTWVLWANEAVQLNTVTVVCTDLPESFSGYKVAQISDLHNAEIGKDNKKLLKILEKARPDIIVYTGDIIDSYRTDVDTAVAFTKKAAEIAPIYFVPGNHESRLPEDYGRLLAEFERIGVTVLENSREKIEINGEHIYIAGVLDPAFEKTDASRYAEIMRGYLDTAYTDEGFCLLLAHRPELFEVYCEYSVDLVLSGHAHGGQIRLPFIGAFYVPGQGLFPEYTEGLHTDGSTNMVISRGIGNSSVPIRFNNRPEVVLIELKSK